jgi:hypothetical protein
MLRNYFVITLRNLQKHLLFTFINISGLSIGIACCIFIFLYISNEWSYDKFHTNEASIYRITTKLKNGDKENDIATTPSPLAATLVKDLPFITTATRIGKWYATFAQGDNVFEEKNIYAVDPSFFSMFSFPMISGNGKQALTQKDAVVITASAAERYFGNDWRQKDIIGKSIRVKAGADTYTFSIGGVVKDAPANSTLQFDFLLPFSFLQTFDNSKINGIKVLIIPIFKPMDKYPWQHLLKP